VIYYSYVVNSGIFKGGGLLCVILHAQVGLGLGPRLL